MFLKFVRKDTFCTLYEGYPLPSPGIFAPPIMRLCPPIKGYHLHTASILPEIKDKFYQYHADLWLAEIDNTLPHQSYWMESDIPAKIHPSHPIQCKIASSIRLVKKLHFKVTPNGIVLKGNILQKGIITQG